MFKFLTLLLLFICLKANGAVHYIRSAASGSNNGSSWANAWTALSSVTLTRGDTYYIAGGSYTGRVLQEETDNGQWITIKKANAIDNSEDLGWSEDFATSQAIITGTTTLQGGRFVLNGVTGGGKSGHGIKFNKVTDSTAWTLGITSGSYYTISHCEIKNSGYNSYNSNGAFHDTGTVKKGINVSYCWLHECSNDGFSIINDVGTSYSDYGLLFENNYVTETGGAGDGGHGQGVKIQGSNAYCIIRNNYFDNNSGSGIIYFIGVAGAPEETNDHFLIYNNIFTVSSPANVAGIAPGAIASDAYTRLSNVSILNNTFANIGSPSYNNQYTSIFLQLTDANNVLQNNIFESGMWQYAISGVTASHNGFFGNMGGQAPANTASNSAFISLTDFRLVSGSYAVYVGLDLSSVFTTDLIGRTRTIPWDIGAYKYYPLTPPQRLGRWKGAGQ